MVKQELVTWIKKGMAGGHELEKLLGHLKSQGYEDIDIIELRAHLSGKKAGPAKSRKSNTFMQVFHWIIGIFFEPEKTIKEVAEKSNLAHVSLMGAVSVAVLFITFLLNNLLVEGTQTLPAQMMEKFTMIIAPQGTFAAIIGFGEMTFSGIFANIIVATLHYFLPLLGIAFIAHLILHGLYHKSTMWKAYKIIGIPYGAAAIAISTVNLAIVPFMFIAEEVGSASFLAKMITSVILGVLVILIFFSVMVSVYSYVAYAMTIREKYETTMISAVLISVASTGAVVLALLPLMAMLVASVF